MSVSRSGAAGHGLPGVVSAMMAHLRHLGGSLRREQPISQFDWRNEPSAPVGWWKAL
ncbi:hypothetical protein [Mycolicibacterium vaccae]|uniref:hypothetical protein n=1 Tax=Mycolicibacterium vaccae TaxID=1810 RepID=UPI003D022E75